MSKKNLLLTATVCLLIILSVNSVYGQGTMALYQEDFEAGQGSWFASNGVWEIGVPRTNPPVGAHSGQNCGGTVLGGLYPANANTRLVSPSINLNTTLQPNERLQLRFWHWFNQFPEDPGSVQISVDNGVTWNAISKTFVWNSNAWTQYIVDISGYVNSTVRLAFYFTSDGRNEANGWYIDDISIVKGIFTLSNPENFELGIGHWFADQGVWEVGAPKTNPPVKAHSGQNCAATVLGGLYSANANTRLISPEITLPGLVAREKLQLRFWQWFNQFPEDPGVVQISVNNGTTWTPISRKFDWNSNAWTQHIIDISSYANATVRFAFYFTSDGRNEANGWYLDDVTIVKGVFILPNPENFELGIGSWFADKGVWEVGMPTAGPSAAHSVPNCAGTVLGGLYPANANTRLISSEIPLIPKPGQRPELFFWHWFNIFPEDSAVVQISVAGGPWQTISQSFNSNSGWTQFFIDLSAYANSTVRLAFYFASDGRNEANGWYIDDIRIEGIVTTTIVANDEEMSMPTEFILRQNYPNPFNPETTILYELPRASQVEVVIFNLLGEKVRVLLNQPQQAGQHRLLWNGRDENEKSVPSGVYFYRLQAGEFVQTRKMILMQ